MLRFWNHGCHVPLTKHSCTYGQDAQPEIPEWASAESEALRLRGKTGDTVFVSAKRICSYNSQRAGGPKKPSITAFCKRGVWGVYIFLLGWGESYS